MEVAGRGAREAHRHSLLEELKGLFGPAFGPALEAYGRPFAERVGKDERFRKEVLDRFERGCALGGFPNLSALLSGATPKELDEFFESGWTRVALPPPGPPRNPWDRLPWAGDRESYREDLYSGLAFTLMDLRTFALEWLEELTRVGYYGMEESLGLPIKQRAGNILPSPEALPLYGESYPVPLEGTRQTVWLNLGGPRSPEGGYHKIFLSEEPLRTDAAIFAALTALEGRPLNIGLLREILPEILPSRGESVWECWVRARGVGARGKKRADENLSEILDELRHHQTLDYVLMLLRYHRPDFDDGPLEERAALLAETCARVNEFLETLRKLMAFVEYGVPGRGAVPITRTAARDVEAAVLKDVEGLTYHEIGERLGVPPPANYSYKGDHAAVRKMALRGRKLLMLALGEEGWHMQAQEMRTEAERFLSLDETRREAQILAEALNIPYEEALQDLEKERGLARRRGQQLDST
jgi:hypothetical protein